MQGLTLACLLTCTSDKEVTEHFVVKFDATNKINYYPHAIITENQTNDATLCLLAT